MLSQNPSEKVVVPPQIETDTLSTDEVVEHQSLIPQRKAEIIQGRLAVAYTTEEKIPLLEAYYKILGPTDYS